MRQNAPRVPRYFFLWGEGGGVGNFFIPYCVPVKFTMGSQHVPNSSSLYPISFAISSTLVAYITSPKEELTTYLIWDYPKVDLFFCEVQSKMPITQEGVATTI